MLLKLLYPLVKYFTFFNIFQYITFRAAYAASTALLISILLGPVVIRKLKEIRVGAEIRVDGPQTHFAKSGTPTMGGVLIILAVVTATFLWQDLENPYTWILLAAAVGFGAVGFLDDYLKVTRRNSRGLPAGLKLSGEFGVAILVVLLLYLQKNEHTTLLYLPFLKVPVLDLSFGYIPLAVLLLVGFSNAVNFTDGLDGLASGLVIMVGIAFAILSYLAGHADFARYLQIPFIVNSWEASVFCMALVGAAVGFLWFNCHPAEIIMGDTGSLSLGGVIGVVALITKKEILLFIVGGVFVLEVASVIIQVVSFKLTGKRVFRMAPLHHHFELMGWNETKVVIRLWILGGLFTLLSLSTLKIQ
jgi:phospho-N-acetylmuramoyl-pentapeptide-transferase